jgi:CheY-like chemotaxis protein
MATALNTLRHDDFAAIIIDKKSVEIDTLEFILNVWDVYAQIPVIVLYESNEANDDLDVLNRQKVFQLTDDIEDVDLEIARILQNVVEEA